MALGKSSKVRESLAAFIAEAKADDRTAEQKIMQGALPHRVLWTVPTHKLSGEALAAMDDLGLHVAVMRGREADVPGTGNAEDDIPPDRMCLNLPAVEDALRIGEDVERAVCGGHKKGALKCPFYDQCAYQSKRRRWCGRMS